jgi:hypothetical protein
MYLLIGDKPAEAVKATGFTEDDHTFNEGRTGGAAG